MKNATKRASDVLYRTFGSDIAARYWDIHHTGNLDAVTFEPVAISRLDPGEGGTFYTDFSVKLAPVNGEMRSAANVEVVQVFVPYPATIKLDNPDDNTAGIIEVIRQKWAAGDPIMGFEPVNDITKSAYSHGMEMGDGVKTHKSVRLAYIAAVNHMRKRVYHRADLLDSTCMTPVPATMLQTTLQRFNAALDPEPLAEGSINLTGFLPVKGIYGNPNAPGAGPGVRLTADAELIDVPAVSHAYNDHPNDHIYVARNGDGSVAMYSDLSGAGEVKMMDLVRARQAEKVVRKLNAIALSDPEHGQEAAHRAIYGLQLERADDCVVTYQFNYQIKPAYHRPTDASGAGMITTHYQVDDNFTTIVPRTECGGQLVTMIVIRPDEGLHYQPDPIQTRPFVPRNRIHDAMALEPEIVTRGELEQNLPPSLRDMPVFWAGHNQMRRYYSSRGVNEHRTPYNVMVDSMMWRYTIPAGVTPQNINYPDVLPDDFYYPFANWEGRDKAIYSVFQQATVVGPQVYGPAPIERMELLQENPGLIYQEEIENV